MMTEKPTYAELEQQVRTLGMQVRTLERAEKINQTLVRVSNALSTTENLDELYASIHKILNDVIELKNFYIANYHPTAKALSFPYFQDEFDDDWSYIEDFSETSSLTGEVILNGAPLLLTQEMLLERSRQDRVMGTVPKVWMGFPLKVKGEVIGVMATQCYENPDQFSQRDFEILNSVSGQIALAIERKRMEAALFESEYRFRTMADAMPCAIYRSALDEHRTMTFISRQIEAISGYPASDFVSNAVRSFASIIHPDDVDKIAERVQAALAADQIWVLEYRIRHADGTIRSVYEEGRAYYADDGSVRFLDGFILDNTERQRSEQALKLSEATYREIFNTVNDTIWIHDIDTFEFIDVNDNVTEMFGYSVSEALDTSLDDISSGIAPCTKETAVERLQKAKAGEPQLFEWHSKHKDGHLFWTEVSLKRGTIAGRDCLIAIERDITARKKADESLRRSEERYRRLLEASPNAIVAYDPNGHIIYVNPAFEKTYGWSATELAGRKLEFVPPHEKEKTAQAVLRNLNGEDVSLETQRLTKGGDLLDIDLKTAIIRDADGNLLGTIVIHRDITASLQAEEENRRLQNLLGNIVDSMPSILVGIDDAGRVTQWNRRAEEETGIKSDVAAGRKLAEVFPRLATEMEKIRSAMQERRTQHNPKRPYRGTMETRYEDVTIYPLVTNGIDGAVIRVDDVTERVRLEEMMIQSEKMMSVGGLAAGMAHEINNPLAGIMQNTQNARNRLSGASPADRRVAVECGTTIEAIRAFNEQRGLITMLETALEAGARAAKIVNNMLSFSRMGDASMTRQDLAGLLDKTVELAQSDYNLKRKYDFRKIRIVREYDPITPEVMCAGSKIQQVFLNIFKNGAEAMAGQANRPTAPQFILRVKPEVDMVRVEIQDNGPGMEAAVRKRIFEPFYTTKSGEGGTGLGLSVSYFIITDNHSGTMSVESEPDNGTCFIIHLPATP